MLLYPWKLQQQKGAQYYCLKEQILSCETLFFNIDITISYAFSLAINKSQCAELIKMCSSGGDPIFHNCYYSIPERKILPAQSSFPQPEEMEI